MENYESSREDSKRSGVYQELRTENGETIRQCIESSEPMTLEEACQLREDQELYYARMGIEATVTVI